MIIVRSPLRISLGGGGTDLPSYYQDHTGFLIAAAIDKYVYITIHQTFVQELIVKYSKLERVTSVEQIEHPIIREALKYVNVAAPHLEITSMADIPAGTGLGSSGSFTTALLKALYTLKKNLIHPQKLAEEACDIELNILKEPIGKQDQYIAAYGGITCFNFHPDHTVQAWPLKIDQETLFNLEDNLLLFFTGYSRSASSILKEQDVKSKNKNDEMINNLHFIKALGFKSQEALEKGDLNTFAELMNVHWQHKKQRSGNMSNNQIDTWYNLALKNGAIGGKMIGAGGGGFLMFYAQDKMKLRHTLRQTGMHEVRFRFDFSGDSGHHSMNKHLFPTVILAGGLATRLRPLTETIPKSLVDIQGEPFISHQLRLLRKNDIHDVIMCIGYLGEQIIETIGNGSQFDLNLSYVFDGPELLGTAGAIKKALPQLPEEFFVMYGDSYLPCHFKAVQKAYLNSRKAALMTVFKNNNQWDTSNVEYKYHQIITYDKQHKTERMQHIDYGLGILSKKIFSPIPDNMPMDLSLLYQTLIVQQELAAYEVKERFYEVGSFKGISELEVYLGNQ